MDIIGNSWAQIFLISSQEEITLFEQNVSTEGQWAEGEVCLPGSSEDLQVLCVYHMEY